MKRHGPLKYSEHTCVLVKKYRAFFRYVWQLEENGSFFRVYVGKGLYQNTVEGSRVIVGRIGHKLVNLRRE